MPLYPFLQLKKNENELKIFTSELAADGLRFVTEIINDRPLEPFSTYFRKHME